MNLAQRPEAMPERLGQRWWRVRAWATRDLRPLRAIPRSVRCAVLALLAAQITWHAFGASPQAEIIHLGPAPPARYARVVALGDNALLARLVVLWMTTYDTQPGASLPYKELDYDHVASWLSLALALDPANQLALLSATRIYANVADEPRRRRMLAWVHQAFMQRPNERWRWLAEAVIIAKHRLRDLPLALAYARDLRVHTSTQHAPFWARDMQIVVLEDMGELEAARILIGGLLAEGQIRDTKELRYLERKLEELAASVRAHQPDTDSPAGAAVSVP